MVGTPKLNRRKIDVQLSDSGYSLFVKSIRREPDSMKIQIDGKFVKRKPVSVEVRF
jgi:hypothetical protein